MARISTEEGSAYLTPEDLRDFARRIREMTISFRMMAVTMERKKYDKMLVANMLSIGRALDALALWQSSLQRAMNEKQMDRVVPNRKKKAAKKKTEPKK